MAYGRGFQYDPNESWKPWGSYNDYDVPRSPFGMTDMNPNAALSGRGIGMQVPSWNRGAPQQDSLRIPNTPTPEAKVASPWPNIGFQAVGAVANWIGDAYGRKQRRQGMERMNSMYNKPVIDVNALTGLRERAVWRNATRVAPGMDKAYGFGQGRFARGLYDEQVGASAQAEADAYYQNALETERRNMEIAQAGANYGR